uniref:F5/8 type C domain-containing protein n=1 Tax=Haptolina ericina TaxID=156174 RepID=A0A7S3B3X5_9EUKA|mmetsp:Transcript_50561/g.113624  ORF Transcript_50561/g.113624 Transcript_50561/m.113624 type:complete len:160 (+) Transcript_50561:262-741(+)
MKFTASNPGGGNWNRHGVCCSTVESGLERSLGSTSGGFGMHTGHGGTIDFPLVITVDLRTSSSGSAFPDGIALNQLKWTVHVNGFRRYEVYASNDGSTFDKLATLDMNGSGSGMGDGSIYTNNWTNDKKYRWYRVSILTNSGTTGKGGWAVYTWQWNRV